MGVEIERHNIFRMGSREIWDHVREHLPEPTAGKSVLDVGCNSGLFGLLLKRQGAEPVIGIDLNDHYLQQARVLDQLLETGVRFENGSVYDLDRLGGPFDIVLALGLLYHLPDPFRALQCLAEQTRELLLIESETNSPFLDPAESLFIQSHYRGDDTNWWLPGSLAVREALLDAGFAEVEALRITEGAIGSSDYRHGFSAGMVQCGERWFFAARKTSRRDKRPTRPPSKRWCREVLRALPEVHSSANQETGQEQETIELSAELDIDRACIGELVLHELDSLEKILQVWRKELSPTGNKEKLAWSIPTENMASGKYVPVLTLYEMPEGKELLDRILFPVQAIEEKTDFESRSKSAQWLIDGQAALATDNILVTNGFEILNADGESAGEIRPGENFTFIVELKGINQPGLMRLETFLLDEQGNLITLIKGRPEWLFGNLLSTRRLGFRFKNCRLNPGSYILGLSLFGAGNQGPWQVGGLGKDGFSLAFQVAGHPTPETTFPSPFDLQKITLAEPVETAGQPVLKNIFSRDRSKALVEYMQTGEPYNYVIDILLPEGPDQFRLEYELLTYDTEPRRLACGISDLKQGQSENSAGGRYQVQMGTGALSLGAGAYYERFTLFSQKGKHQTDNWTRRIQVHAADGAVEGFLNPEILLANLAGAEDKFSEEVFQPLPQRIENNDSSILTVKVLREDGERQTTFKAGEAIRIKTELVLTEPDADGVLEVAIIEAKSFRIIRQYDSQTSGLCLSKSGRFSIELVLRKLLLIPGNYFIRIKLWDHRFDEALAQPSLLSISDLAAFIVTD